MTGFRLFMLWVWLSIGNATTTAWLTITPADLAQRIIFQGGAIIAVWLANKYFWSQERT